MQQLKNISASYLSSLLFSVITFFIASVVDIWLSITHQLFVEAWLMGISATLSIVFSFLIYYTRKRFEFIPVLFLLLLGGLSYLVFKYGVSTGSFFYFFPTAILYIINTNDVRNKTKFWPFFLISFGFVVSIILLSFFLSEVSKIPLQKNVFIFRLITAIILSSLLLRHLLQTFTYKKNSRGRKNYYEALFQSQLDAYIVYEKDTREIIDFNKQSSVLLELPPELSLKGLYITQLMMRYLSSDSVNLEILMNHIPDNWHGEGKFITHEKKGFTGYVKSDVFSEDDKDYIILSIRDISFMKETEQKLITSNEDVQKSNKAKARFLSGISHELRTPLNGIIGTSHLLLSETTIDEKLKNQLKQQLNSAEHMLSIINNVLDFSKIDSGKMEIIYQPFNLLNSLTNIINSFTNQFNKNNIQLLYSFDEGLRDIYINSDEVKLRQVLDNLLSNALKFTFDGSVSLNVTIEAENAEEISILFKIKDTGIGIKKEHHHLIFEDFSQVYSGDLKRRFGGTGLGLSLSAKLINLFGGNIKLESEINEGSLFYFTLDFKKDSSINVKVPATKINAQSNHIDIRGIRVLIVEDNEMNSAVLKSFLKKWEIRIKEASNGVHAIELLKFHKFDLILMDLEMPEMNGYTTTKIIREKDLDVPIIAFTATLLENMDTLILEEGFNDYILKPFKPNDLKNKIEHFVSSRKIEYA